MRYALITCCCFIVMSANAQLNRYRDSVLHKNPNYSIERLTSQLKKNAANVIVQSQPTDNMCVALPKSMFTYVDNNNHTNIYTATPDNMPVIKPDSTIAFAMPVKKDMFRIEPAK